MLLHGVCSVIHAGAFLSAALRMYYDVATGKFVAKWGIADMATLFGSYTSTKAVPAVHFPECRGA